MKEKIISDMKESGEYGKFSPYSLGLCPYNFSTAAIYFPEVTREYILEKGGYWDEGEGIKVEGMETSDLPDSIDEVDENICKQALVCPVTGWRYNISTEELSFLKRNRIAIPRVHFDVRTKERVITTSPTKGELHQCIYCKKDINAYYPKNWGYEKISCESCYLKEIS